MALPTSRNTTYTPADPVKSVDLNAIQDMTVGMKHGPMVHTIHPVSGWGATGSTATPNLGWINLGTGVFYLPVNLSEGARITKIEIAMLGNGAADVDITLNLADSTSGSAPAQAPMNPASVVNFPAAWGSSTFNFAPGVTIPAGRAAIISFNPSAAGLFIGPVRVTYDRP